MTTEISAKKQCLYWMSTMTICSVGCSLINRVIPNLPWKDDNPTVTTAALFGSIWGATIHLCNFYSPKESLTGPRRIEILSASAILPSCILQPAGKSFSQILSPFIPIAIFVIAYRIFWAKQNGHRLI